MASLQSHRPGPIVKRERCPLMSAAALVSTPPPRSVAFCFVIQWNAHYCTCVKCVHFVFATKQKWGRTTDGAMFEGSNDRGWSEWGWWAAAETSLCIGFCSANSESSECVFEWAVHRQSIVALWLFANLKEDAFLRQENGAHRTFACSFYCTRILQWYWRRKGSWWFIITFSISLWRWFESQRQINPIKVSQVNQIHHSITFTVQ